MVAKAKKKKAEKEPFWKKISPEVKSFLGHVGKAVDNMKPNDWINLAIYGGLAYASFNAWGTSKRTELRQNVPYQASLGRVAMYEGMPVSALLKSGFPVDWTKVYYAEAFETRYRSEYVEVVEHNPLAVLYGPIALKLATTDNLISAGVGCSLLAGLGIAYIKPPPVTEAWELRLLEYTNPYKIMQDAIDAILKRIAIG